MDIDKMEAGREMDALMAERVMGWRVDKVMYATWVVITDNYTVRQLCGTTKGCWGNWSPSTDISAAWLVVEKMREAPNFVSIIHDGMMWVVTFENGNKACRSDFELPIAICRAALKAVESE